MSFENFPPERDGAAAIPPINRSHGLNALSPSVYQLGRVVPGVRRAAIVRAICNAGR